MKFKNSVFLTTITSSLLMLSACGSSKNLTYGERIQNQGAETQVIGRNWSEGEKLVTKGNALIQSGNKDIDKGQERVSKGQATLREGQSLKREGNQLKTQAEESYQRHNAYEPIL